MSEDDLLDQFEVVGEEDPTATPASAPGAPEVERAIKGVPRPQVNVHPEPLIPLTAPERADPNFHPAPVAQAAATPKATAATGSVSAYKPSNWDRLKAAVPAIGAISSGEVFHHPMDPRDVTQAL